MHQGSQHQPGTHSLPNHVPMREQKQCSSNGNKWVKTPLTLDWVHGPGAVAHARLDGVFMKMFITGSNTTLATITFPKNNGRQQPQQWVLSFCYTFYAPRLLPHTPLPSSLPLATHPGVTHPAHYPPHCGLAPFWPCRAFLDPVTSLEILQPKVHCLYPLIRATFRPGSGDYAPFAPSHTQSLPPNPPTPLFSNDPC